MRIGRLTGFSLRLALGAWILLAAATGLAMSPAEKQRIVDGSVAAYLASGHPCACPYSLDRRGRPCGPRSAYVRPGGRKPFCYPSDVPDDLEVVPERVGR